MLKKKWWIIIATLLIGVGVVGAIINFSSAVKPSAVKKVIPIHEAFSAINVETNDARINVKPTHDKTAKVIFAGKRNKKDEQAKLSASVVRDTLDVDLQDRSRRQFDFDLFESHVSLTVYIPEKAYDELVLNSDNGTIHVDGLQVAKAHVETQNGRLHAKDMSGTNLKTVSHNGVIEGENLQFAQVDTRSANGKIALQHVRADKVKAKSNNGKLTLNKMVGVVQGHTKNGAITMNTDHFEDKIKLSSNNGKITIQTTKKPTNATFIANSNNGHIDIFGHNGGTVLGNGDHKVELTTKNGGIKVSQQDE